VLNRSILLTLLVALGATVPASAASVSYSSSFGLWPAGYYSDAPFAECTKLYGSTTPCSSSGAAQGNVDLTRFDPALGTLTGITLTLDSVMALGVEVFGTRDGGFSTVDGYAQYSIGSLLSGTTQTLSITCAGFCNEYTPSGVQPVDVDAQANVQPADFAGFVGTTPLALLFAETVFTSGSASFADIGVIARTRTINGYSGIPWQGTLSVTYDYTTTPVPVPEPSVLLLGAMACVTGLRRRAQQR
jgi:hypothetical protein